MVAIVSGVGSYSDEVIETVKDNFDDKDCETLLTEYYNSLMN